MGRDITTVGGLTIGLDLGDKHTVGCVLPASGEVEDGYYIFSRPIQDYVKRVSRNGDVEKTTASGALSSTRVGAFGVNAETRRAI